MGKGGRRERSQYPKGPKSDDCLGEWMLLQVAMVLAPRDSANLLTRFAVCSDDKAAQQCAIRHGGTALFGNSAEIHVLGAGNCFVMTRDVLSFSFVTSDSFPAKSTSVLFWSTQCELCQFCLTQCGVEQLLLSTACTVQELSGTSGACCFFLCCQFILVTRLSS